MTTNPIAHGLRGLSFLTADLPTDTAARLRWLSACNEALAEGIRINSTEGIDALTRAIVDEERAAELEAASDAAQAAHEAAEARLLALETAKHALGAYSDAVEELAPEDKALPAIVRLHTSTAWCALDARIMSVKADVSRLEDVAHEAAEALRAYEEVET